MFVNVFGVVVILGLLAVVYYVGSVAEVILGLQGVQ
jgi:hypothetical protein